MARGELHVFLSAGPAGGALVAAARSRAADGEDVVVGCWEDAVSGTPHTGLPMVTGDPGVLDVDAVIARAPDVVVVDSLASGSGSGWRWQDVDDLRAACITVLTTLRLGNIASLNDVVGRITGELASDTVPDEVVRTATSIELVDAVERGELDSGQRALRELAAHWLAGDDRADERAGPAERTRERVVVALAGGSEGEMLVRRAARIAGRGTGADLMAVHVARSDDLTEGDPTLLAKDRLLVESLGGTFHQVIGSDVAASLREFARAKGATQLVVGATQRNRLAQLLSPGVGTSLTSRPGPLDVHLVTHEEARPRRQRRATKSALSSARRLSGFALALLGLPLVTMVLLRSRDQIHLPTDVLVVLLVVVAVTLVGGLWPALVAAIGGFLLLNFFFTEPLRTFIIADLDEVIALVVFLVVALVLSAMVDYAARRSRDAARASADAKLLATVAGSVLGGQRPLTALLERLRETFTLDSVTVLERDTESGQGTWRIAATTGKQPSLSPADGDTAVPADDEFVLVLRGRPLPAADQHIVEAFAAQAALAVRQRRLAAEAAAVRPLTEADKMRTALLAAVSHDLRTPLSSAKAAVTSLRHADVVFSESDRAELLETADESLDRLGRLVSNLLDMSRLQAGVLGVSASPIGIEDVVPRALDELGEQATRVRVRIGDALPAAVADPGLLERILVNVVGNAIRYSSADRPPLVTASASGDKVELRVIDHGPGIPEEARERVFLPFQRLGDRGTHSGVGLGLALSSGLAEAMGGSLVPATTPGGGLTMVLTLVAAGASVDQAEERV
ncbi:MAG: DUF4118 domain-containing protein [Actinophytocola sp.]|nr:DUF4118 domain-containing protein [Actinophytocola sp.]